MQIPRQVLDDSAIGTANGAGIGLSLVAVSGGARPLRKFLSARSNAADARAVQLAFLGEFQP